VPPVPVVGAMQLQPRAQLLLGVLLTLAGVSLVVLTAPSATWSLLPDPGPASAPSPQTSLSLSASSGGPGKSSPPSKSPPLGGPVHDTEGEASPAASVPSGAGSQPQEGPASSVTLAAEDRGRVHSRTAALAAPG